LEDCAVTVSLRPPLIIKSDDGILVFGSVDATRVYIEVPDDHARRRR
jgi:hypothetical protein